MNNAPYLFIVGCTASGKSALAVEVAKKMSCDIISCDSMQIYRGMDIGTAKPSLAERKGIRHHMIDVADIDEEYTVADYVCMAKEFAGSVPQGKPPMFVGGTGLYVNGLIYGYNFADTSASADIRARLRCELDEKGRLYMYEKLQTIDPKSAAETHPNNTVRVLRALEIFLSSGRPKSDAVKAAEPHPYLAVALDVDRDELYNTINLRVDKMISSGLIDEVEGILKRGYSPKLRSLAAIGYKEIIDYLQGRCDLRSAVEAIKMNTRRYAKRQITWFKRLPEIIQLKPSVECSDIVVEKYYNFARTLT